MNRKVYGVLVILLAASLLAGCGSTDVLAGGGTAAYVTAEAVPAAISVAGTGIAKSMPDIAYVMFGVESRDPDAAAAVADNTTRMQAVMQVLEDYGIAAGDVETVNYSMWLEQPPRPETVVSSETQVETKERYYVTNQIRVTVRDLDTVGDVLGAVLEAGANNVQGIQFAIEDTDALLAEARDKAIEDAKAKAQQYADGFDTTIKGVYSVSEVGISTPVMARAEVYGIGGGAASVPVSSGELSVSVSVQVAFEIVH